jgi:hypothetical protein
MLKEGVMQRVASIVATVIACGLAAWHAPGAAQTQRQPSPMQQGAGQMMYGSCMVDVLTGTRGEATAVLAALNPAMVRGLVQTYEDSDEIGLWCSKAIHDQRCTTKIVAVLGDALTSQPGGKVLPPSQNPYLVPFAVGGAVLGGLAGNTQDHPVIGAVAGAAGGAWVAGKMSSNVYNAQMATSCALTQRQLDDASVRLTGTLGPFGSAGAQDVLLLIADNLRQQRITKAQADALNAEVQRLAAKVAPLLQAMR